ncbi:hypothetical protein MERGE_000181 [Pneumocystis wakefieldiae]|uniref:Major surface glycoprotein 2 C-terminal domain-containing protein n=1 Tax=Pneumocystis wakefieldiae TaxID=38082 RepID=A0A899G370_9ASCO|nr:hypothetical protein MERGE_000181 [Pneumocystis wakefieldiae]
MNSGFQYSVSEESIFVSILKESYDNESECKEKLRKYCQELKEADPDLENVDDRVKKFCQDAEQIEEKCKNLITEIKEKIKEIETKIKTSISNPQDFHCAEYEKECLFLDQSSPRQEVAYEILFRALNGAINDTNNCTERMKEVCPILSEGSDELMLSCLNPDTSCQELQKKINDFCNPLNSTLNENELEGKCYERLEECHFYSKNCNETKCDEVKEKCEKKKIKFEIPGSDFIPIEPKGTLLDEILLGKVYERWRNKGIFVGMPEKKSLGDILLLLSKEKNSDKKCNEAFNKCDNSKHLNSELKALCGNGEREKKCKELVNVTARCSETIYWHQLSRSLTEEECIEFESSCFYLESMCENTLKKTCKHARMACYKRAQEMALFGLFRDRLRGKLNSLKSENRTFKECQQVVLDNCRGIKNKEHILRCLMPKKLCLEFSEDISTQSQELKQILDVARDFYTKKECTELKKRCEDLEKDSIVNYWTCIALNLRCKYSDVVEELENIFLIEEKGILKDQESCEEALKEKCDHFSKREADVFSILCILQKETCQSMIKRMKNYCGILKENIEKEKILDDGKGKDEELPEEVCLLWSPYCDQLMENCPDLLKKESDNNNGVCLKLKVNCKSIIDRLQLEDALAYELKGNLITEEKCKEALGRYCAQSINTKSHRFSSLCNDGSKQKNGKNGVCEKLVKKVREKCPSLESGLEKAKKELNEKKSKYDDLKKEAEEEVEKNNLFLSRLEEGLDEQSMMKRGAFALPILSENDLSEPTDAKIKLERIRRSQVDAGISEVERKGLSAVAKTLELYLELKEECKILQLDCDFKEDCPGSKEVCGKIDEFCNLKSLKIKPSNTTTTITETETTVTTETFVLTPETSTVPGKTIENTITIIKTMNQTEIKYSSPITLTTTKFIEGNCTTLCDINTQETKTSFQLTTVTSTVTTTSIIISTVRLTSTLKCTPTKSTTDSTKETQKPEPTWCTTDSTKETQKPEPTKSTTDSTKETQKPEPTKSTTDSIKETQKEEEVKPNEGVKIRISEMIKIIFFGTIIMGIL